MNITLSAQPQTIQIVREWASSNETSLNQYIRDILEEKAKAILAERRRKSVDFANFFVAHRVSMPDGWKFSREEANGRDMKCLHNQ